MGLRGGSRVLPAGRPFKVLRRPSLAPSSRTTPYGVLAFDEPTTEALSINTPYGVFST